MGPELAKKLPVIPALKLSKWEMGFMFFGSLSATGLQLGNRRPMKSAYPIYIAGLVIGYYMGRYAEDFSENRKNMKVVILEDYISKHPEDFPLVESQKYKDLLLPWHPNR